MKKWIALLLAAVTALGMFAGCSGSGSDTDEDDFDVSSFWADITPGTFDDATGALAEILESGVLTVALSPDFAPMEFVDTSKSGQDQYVGFDPMLAQYLAYYFGVELEIQAMGFETCQTAVYTANVPMAISGFSVTPERAEQYELSDYYYAGENETEQVILVLESNAEKYTSFADLAGLDVGAQVASLQMNLLTAQIPDANPVTVADLGTGVLMLQNGEIEALCVAKGNATAIMASNSGLAIMEEQFEVSEEAENNVILITKGETDLLDAVNEALAKAYAAGIYGEMYAYAQELAGLETAEEITIEEETLAAEE
ncbi:MAG: transporter substrate-binding domain-containing protein [Firmicutes bacterium]|nr:transporter substrate-binding domain-containing protein [Bacillota bacterium]